MGSLFTTIGTIVELVECIEFISVSNQYTLDSDWDDVILESHWRMVRLAPDWSIVKLGWMWRANDIDCICHFGRIFLNYEATCATTILSLFYLSHYLPVTLTMLY